MTSSPARTARLSCEQCKRRKTKCDKEDPCTACTTSGIKCITVQRARKPRGRTAHKRDEIDTRVAKLEGLVRQLKAQVQLGKEDYVGHESSSPGELTQTAGPARKNSSTIQTYVASDFWEALSHEANGIREILEEFDTEDASSDPPNASPTQDLSSSSGIILFSASTTALNEVSAQYLTPQMREKLRSIYQTRVDAIFKVLHWPSFLAGLETRDTQTDVSIQTYRMYALESAMYYTALSTVSDVECESICYCQKAPLLQQLKVAAEASISQTRLLEQPDVMTLQAFFIYLVGLRSTTTYASAWTLLSVAVRIASALGLGSEHSTKFSVYELQIRRRLWLSIGVMDTQLSLDRGTSPLLESTQFKDFPALVNDLDLYPQSISISSTSGFTDMSFSAMTQQAMICQKRLYDTNDNADDPWSGWKQQVATIAVFENYINTNLSHINASSTPLEQFTQAVALGSLANIQLMLRRPPYLVKRTTAVPPWDDFNIMQATTDILQRSLNKRARGDFAPWQWFAWVKWYVLAVLLVELLRPGQGAEIEHSYLVAQSTFTSYSQTVADSESGMLWRPIVKLMRRVDRLRGKGIVSMPGPPPSPPPPQAVDMTAFDHTSFDQTSLTKLDLSSAYEAAIPPGPVLLDQNMADRNTVVYPMPSVAGSQQTETGDLFSNDLSWISWDTFLDDINNSSNLDWGVDWHMNG